MTAKHVARGAIRPVTGARVRAVLGPTNTGKTHFAIERMLAHSSGMMGLPLRLLAREIYDKVVRIKGAQVTALVTGEEKIVPAQARYFVCTVEAMPTDLRTAFLAIDEIQLCADLERGHVFTDRLLRARGEQETMFLGAETMRSAIRRFVPEAAFVTRPRFSDLAFTGHRKLSRLPRRSAIVAFSAEGVYGIAEVVRRQRGGAAVVLGALSPRTRNAQVALYQSGEVDFLVATDAIGMGLNMDIDHIAFAASEKFDGAVTRPLRPDELGQIAGRAGRHMNDGTFGLTVECNEIDEDTIVRIEAHRYEPVRRLQWRNSDLCFASLTALAGSLEMPPPQRGFAKARPAMDIACLRLLASRADIARVATAPAAVKLLWEVCQLPDFRKLSIEDHARLVESIYCHLVGDEASLPEDWLARHIARLDEIEGDVAALSGRLAQIRTWTYAAHRPGWVRDAAHWQELTRAVEDRLSDALHERLTQRFVDRRTAILLRSLRDEETLRLQLDVSGAALLGGEAIGKIEGFRFAPDPRAEGFHGRTLRAAALKGLEIAYAERAGRLVNADDSKIALSDHGRLRWDGAPVAALARGNTPFDPGLTLFCDDELRSDIRESIATRLGMWLSARVETCLGPLTALRRAADARSGTPLSLRAGARGIAHQICEGFGSLDRRGATLPPDLRQAQSDLRPFGVRFGRHFAFMPHLLRPGAAHLLALLWCVWAGQQRIPAPPAAGLTSCEPEAWWPDGFLRAAGYWRVGPRAIRLDIVERLEEALEAAARSGSTSEDALPGLVSLLGSSAAVLEQIVTHLGWIQTPVGEAASRVHVWRRGRARRRPDRRSGGRAFASPVRESPFAELAGFLAGN